MSIFWNSFQRLYTTCVENRILTHKALQRRKERGKNKKSNSPLRQIGRTPDGQIGKPLERAELYGDTEVDADDWDRFQRQCNRYMGALTNEDDDLSQESEEKMTGTPDSEERRSGGVEGMLFRQITATPENLKHQTARAMEFVDLILYNDPVPYCIIKKENATLIWFASGI